METKMSIEQVIEITANGLANISIPATILAVLPKGYGEYLGREISNAQSNLLLCLEAIRKGKEEQKEEEKDGDS